MRLKIVSALFIFMLAIPTLAFADDDKDVRDLPRRQRIIVGGNLGLQIGNLSTMVNISPTIGYRLTNRITPGISLTYQYYRDTGWGNMAGFTSVTHLYGGSFFTRYRITRDFFAHGEVEALNLDSQLNWMVDPGTSARFWEYNYFIGGGYRAALSDRTFINLMVLYNLNNNSVVYFQNPIFRLGVDVRL